MARNQPPASVPSGQPVEIVADDPRRAKDSVAAWLALDREVVNGQQGASLFGLGVPCQRRKIRDAQKRFVYVDGGRDQVGGAEVAWGSPLIDGDIGVDENYVAAHEAKIEEREISPAVYEYEAPIVLAWLPPGVARWAYETFKAAELDSMYRLRDNTNWTAYVEELRNGMEEGEG